MVQTTSPLHKQSSIYVAGHRGMVGSAIVRLLQRKGYKNIITRSSRELDLTDQAAVHNFFQNEKIDYVVLAAAKVGGIHANNTYPAEFIYKNLMIQNNVINEAYKAGIKHLLFLGSSCIYPKHAPQPMREEHLLTGILEPTNEPYAIAKIAGIKMCDSYNRQYGCDFRAVMPTNLYGPGDNYHLENSHVIPAIIRKYHLAKQAAGKNFAAIKRDEEIFGEIPKDIRTNLGLDQNDISAKPVVSLWGTGSARREFLHVDDMASACFHVMQLDRNMFAEAINPASRADPTSSSPISFLNIGTGVDCTIGEVAEIICEVVGFKGETRYNSNQPDGTPRKLLDTSRITSLGWQPSFSLREGLQDAYQWYCKQLSNV